MQGYKWGRGEGVGLLHKATGGGIHSQRERQGLLDRPVARPTRKPQPSMHATSTLLKDHVFLVLLGPIMPEDKARGGFDGDRLPQEVTHLGLGHPKLESWPTLMGRALAHRGQGPARLSWLVRDAGCGVAYLACHAHSFGRAWSLQIRGGPGLICDRWQGALHGRGCGRRDGAPVPA